LEETQSAERIEAGGDGNRPSFHPGERVGDPNSMKLAQINLHHSKAVTAVLRQQLADVALIQEPWLYRGKTRGLTNSGGTIFSVAPEGMQGPVFIPGTRLMPYRCWSSVLGM
jgi:hypothetical protein